MEHMFINCKDKSMESSKFLTIYYKLKKLWDDLNQLRPLPTCDCRCCTCGLTKRIGELDLSNNTIQFLMGLNDNFDGV